MKHFNQDSSTDSINKQLAIFKAISITGSWTNSEGLSKFNQSWCSKFNIFIPYSSMTLTTSTSSNRPYSSWTSKICNLKLSESILFISEIILRTVVDFPEPVLPNIALWCVNSLLGSILATYLSSIKPSERLCLRLSSLKIMLNSSRVVK